MVRIRIRRAARWAAPAALALALLTSSPTALADPSEPPPPPTPTPAGQAAQPDQTVQTVSTEQAPAAEVPHLSSPTNLPPGTTDDPSALNQGRGMSYLRELWHAVQTQDVSGGDALLLLTQRPMSADATPPAGLSVGPQGAGPAIADPAAPADPATPADAPAPPAG